MIYRFRHLAVVGCFVFAGPFATADQPAATTQDPGVFVDTGSGLSRLPEAPSPGIRGRGMLSYLFHPAPTPSLRYSYRGRQAPLRISERKPVFHLRFSHLPLQQLRSIQLVRLKTGSDSREARAAWDSRMMPIWFTDAVPVAIGRGANGALTITPSSALEPGEYLLSIGFVLLQYEFGVS